MGPTIAVALKWVPLHVEVDPLTGSVDADLRIEGNAGQIASFNGGGDARISEGYLFAIPVLGPLSKLVAAGNGNNGGGNIAKEASASFRLVNGVIVTEDIEALTQTFRVKAAGTISLVDQSVDLEAVVNTRGALSSTLLTPVSELLTYSCTGTVRDPVWKPKHISNLGKIPATLISELTNIPVEGLKRLGQLGQEIFSAPQGQRDRNPDRERRFPWGGNNATSESGNANPTPRRLFPLLQNGSGR